jgi:hypothetical protein
VVSHLPNYPSECQRVNTNAAMKSRRRRETCMLRESDNGNTLLVRISGGWQTIMASLVKVSVPGDYAAIDQSSGLLLFQRGRAGL